MVYGLEFGVLAFRVLWFRVLGLRFSKDLSRVWNLGIVRICCNFLILELVT